MIHLFVAANIKNRKFLIEEARYYLKNIFDAEIAIANTLDNANFSIDYLTDDMDEDHIAIDMEKGEVSIRGNSSIGCLIGLYRFLEELGTAFLRPGRENEKVPHLGKERFENLVIKVDETASYKHRGVCIEGANSLENVIDFIDWLPKIGMNSFFIQFDNPKPFLKRWYAHELNPYCKKESVTEVDFEEMCRQIDHELHIRNLVHHRVGHGWTSQVLGYPAQSGWETGAEIAEGKKAFIAEINGERQLFHETPIMTSLDFSNSEVNVALVSSVVEYARSRSDVDYLHVWLSDAYNNICECERCQKEMPTDQYVEFLNMLDSALTNEGLKTKICFLIYHELLFAPKEKMINNPDRFVLMFAPISRTFETSYADIPCDNLNDQLPAYVRNQFTLPSTLEENLAFLAKWQEKFKGDSFVYDYPLGRAHYGDLGYMGISEIILKDIQSLNKLGTNGYISCQELRAGFPTNFPNYVMGKGLWKDTVNLKDLRETYFLSMYGPDGEKVAIYLENLSEFSSWDYFNAIGSRVNPELSQRFASIIELADKFIEIIEKNVVSQTGIQKEEWIRLAYHREYTMKMAQSLKDLSLGNTQGAFQSWEDLLDYIRRNEMSLQNILDVYRVIEVSKNYAGFD